MAKVSNKNAEFNLKSLAKSARLTEDGRTWLIAATDPFHDFETAVAGIPDTDSEPSVVQIIPQTVTVNAPPNLLDGEKWSCHITSLPLANTIDVTNYWQAPYVNPANANFPYGIVIPESAAAPIGGVQVGKLGTITAITHRDGIRSFPSDFNSSLSAATFPDNTREYRAISLDDNNSSTIKKVIGAAFEVHNDTPSLTKSGSVTVYGAPQKTHTSVDSYALTYDVGAQQSRQEFQACRQPPSDQEAATSMPNQRTWSAASGCLVPVHLSEDTTYQPATHGGFRTREIDSTDTTVHNNGYVQAVLGPDNHIGMFRHRRANVGTSGAYFSGLSGETVLTLTVRFVVELAPTPSNRSLLFSATPTPVYDPRALALYFAIIRSMPPGVKVNENAAGDYFRKVIAAAMTALPIVAPVATAISPALGGAVSAAATAARVANAAVVAYDASQRSRAPTQRVAAAPVKRASKMPRLRPTGRK